MWFFLFFYLTTVVFCPPNALSARLRHRIAALKNCGIARFAWPARCPSVPLKISKCHNYVKFYEFRKSDVNIVD